MDLVDLMDLMDLMNLMDLMVPTDTITRHRSSGCEVQRAHCTASQRKGGTAALLRGYVYTAALLVKGCLDRQTDRQTDRPTDRPTDRQADCPTGRLTDRPTDRQAD